MTGRAFASVDVDCDLPESDFRLVADIIRREAGIVVRAHKQAMVRGRLARRARELGIPSIAAYCERLKGPGLEAELPGLLNALTTNHTAFYREPHHFMHLQETALPRLMEHAVHRQRLRIWCAAASSGEEPYTIAATLKAFFKAKPHPDCLVLATDIDSEMLDVAEQGAYPAASMARLEDAQRLRLEAAPDVNNRLSISSGLKSMVRFRQLNILHDWPFKGPFQAIFCRNMLIYFDQPTKTAIIERMVQMLPVGGYLYLGHSEALPGAVSGIQACGRSTYIRV